MVHEIRSGMFRVTDIASESNEQALRSFRDIYKAAKPGLTLTGSITYECSGKTVQRNVLFVRHKGRLVCVPVVSKEGWSGMLHNRSNGVVIEIFALSTFG